MDLRNLKVFSTSEADLLWGPFSKIGFYEKFGFNQYVRDENFKTVVTQYIAKRKAHSTAANIPLCE